MIIMIGVNLTIRPGGTTTLYNLPETKTKVWHGNQPKRKYIHATILYRTVAPMPQLWVPINQGDNKS